MGGVPYREGIFSVWNDPAKFGLFYHSALMLRRGDVQPANNGQMGAGGNCYRRERARHDGSDLMFELRHAAKLKMDRRV